MILAGRIYGPGYDLCHREGYDQELLDDGQEVVVIDVQDGEETVSDDSSDAASDEESMMVFRMKLAQLLAPREELGEDDRV